MKDIFMNIIKINTMFVIACKYSKIHNYVINLVKSIREFHPNEEIRKTNIYTLSEKYLEI